jgi:putative transposase
LQINRSLYVYKLKRGGQAHPPDRADCRDTVRYGYRRIHVLLLREGWRLNPKQVYCLYRELGLQLRHKPPKRRVKVKLREDLTDAIRPDDTWAVDFVHDQLATGKKLRVLTVVDIFSKFLPVVDPRFSYRAEDVEKTLEKVCSKTGYPKTIRVDQGSEFISAILMCRLIMVASFSTSHDQANQLTMPLLKASTASSERNA